MRRLLLLMCFCLLLIASPVLARTWYINPDGTGDAPTIQAGIDSAAAGDTVSLADGTYGGSGNRDIDYLGKAIVVRSEGGDPDLCTIDCNANQYDQHRGFAFQTGEDEQSVLEGITVTRASWGTGAAILCTGASPTIRGCVLSRNRAEWGPGNGGGIGCDISSCPTIIGCTFLSNYAEGVGGGISCKSLLITDCTFSGNVGATEGGALVLSDSVIVTNCSFSGNGTGGDGGAIWCPDGAYSPEFVACVFTGNSAGYSGGAISCWSRVSPIVTDCTFSENTAPGGGGLVCGDCTMRNCLFYRNSASYRSGGGAAVGRGTVTDCIFLENSASEEGGALSCISAAVSNCTFGGNSAESGGGIRCGGQGAPTIVSCTFYGNAASVRGAGIHCYFSSSIVVIENSIIAFSTAGEAVYCSPMRPATLTCCDLFGNLGGDWVGYIADQCGINGNFSECPSFCSADGGDFHLCDQSPCLPGNHPDGYDCGLIGAWGEGCSCGPSQSQPTSWGALKVMYK